VLVEVVDVVEVDPVPTVVVVVDDVELVVDDVAATRSDPASTRPADRSGGGPKEPA
jgi:hypothetical protein